MIKTSDFGQKTLIWTDIFFQKKKNPKNCFDAV